MPSNSEDETNAKAGFLAYLEELGGIAHNGLLFADDPFDIERYHRIQTIAAEMIKLASGLPREAAEAWLSLEQNYATPKIDVRGLVLQGDDVLLVRERTDGRWTLPGGWCDINESPKEAVEKEVLEETGLTVRATRLLALFDKHKHDHPFQIPHAYKCFFLCEVQSGALLTDTMETSAIAYKPWKKLPPLSLHRVTEKQIRTTVAMARDPFHPAKFD